MTSTLLFVHTDGTAKRVRGDQFEVKTKRTKIKANKDGVDILCIFPVPDSGYLVGTYRDEYQKCVDLSGISFQGISGGGIRAFYTEKHILESVVFAEEAPLPVLTFATQPKLYT